MDKAKHIFEAVGLGKAPFRIVGVEARRGPLTYVANGVEITCGAPGQPMGTCDYCGTGIAECWLIESSDGKRHIVGCECVRKTGDRGLRRTMNRELTAKRNARADERIAAARERLADFELRAQLMALPSPQAIYRPSDTAYDWVSWMMKHAGRSGMMKVVRFLDKLDTNGKAKRHEHRGL